MRAFVTLEGIALSADDGFNMYAATFPLWVVYPSSSRWCPPLPPPACRYAATAPYAAKKLLTPQTAGGRALLRAAVGSAEGRRAMRQVLAPLVRRGARALLNPLKLLRRLVSMATGGRLRPRAA